MRFALYTNPLDTVPTPEWIKTERYMYCDNFIYDYMKSNVPLSPKRTSSPDVLFSVLLCSLFLNGRERFT